MRPSEEPGIPVRAFATGAGRVLLVVAASQTLVCAFRVLTATVTELLGDYLADDAFYYFQIARNAPHLEATRGITTTGFHPLWELLLVPVFRVLHDFDAVRASVILLVACHVGAGLMLFAYLRRLWVDAAAAVVAGLWIASPALRTIVMYGLEAALVEMSLVGLLLACDPRAEATTRRCAGIGAVVGAAYLARNDSLLVTLPIAGAWAWSRRRDFTVRGAARVSWGLGTALAVMAPWVVHLALNDSLLGTDAVRALPLVPSSEPRAAAALRTLSGLPLALVSNTESPARGVVEIVLFGLIAAGLVAALVLRRRAWTPPEVALGVSVPVLHAAQLVVLGGIREWYLAYEAVLLFVVFLPPLAGAVARRAGRWRLLRRRAPRTGLAVASAAGLILVAPFATFPQEAGKHDAALAAAPLVGAERVGSFNSGVVQFVLADRDVVNLDGVVNREVLPHVRARTICTYLARERITFLLDDAGRIDSVVADEPRITVVDRQVLSPAIGYFGPIELVRIDTRACG